MAARKSVTIEEPARPPAGDEPTSRPFDEAALGRQKVLRDELARMKARDENGRARKRQQRLKAVKEAKEKMHKDKIERGITILPDADRSRDFVRKSVEDEYRLSLKKKQEELDRENTRIQADIDEKLGISALPKGDDLMILASDFYHDATLTHQHLPDHVTKALTTQEISDLKVVFDLFDAKNKGYITADDLRQVTNMLGYRAKKRVFKEMINEISSKDKKGRVTFVSFLDLVVKLQADGPDPYEEMQRGFRLLDQGDKGFITSADLRQAADSLGVSLSNTAIREMMEEADLTGDGKVTVAEFTKVISQAETFTAPSL